MSISSKLLYHENLKVQNNNEAKLLTMTFVSKFEWSMKRVSMTTKMRNIVGK